MNVVGTSRVALLLGTRAQHRRRAPVVATTLRSAVCNDDRGRRGALEKEQEEEGQNWNRSEFCDLGERSTVANAADKVCKVDSARDRTTLGGGSVSGSEAGGGKAREGFVDIKQQA